ncbi:hypothetical protein AKH09_19490, partial [Vibrio parahaemolyticus]
IDKAASLPWAKLTVSSVSVHNYSLSYAVFLSFSQNIKFSKLSQITNSCRYKIVLFSVIVFFISHL